MVRVMAVKVIVLLSWHEGAAEWMLETWVPPAAAQGHARIVLTKW